MANQPHRARREPKTQEATATREKILSIARELFAERGFDGTSVRTIARKAGISDPAIHYYFPTKYDLFRALMVHPEYPAGHPVRNIEDAVTRLEALFDWWRENAALVRALLQQQLRGDQEAIAFLREGEARYHTDVADILAALQHPGDPRQIADLLFHSLSGMLWDAVMTYGNRAREILGQPVFRERVRFTIRAALGLERCCE